MTDEIKLPPFPDGMCLREDIEDYAREAVRMNMPDGWKLVPVETLEEARNLAMEWTSRGLIPECGAFARIAQDLDSMLAAASSKENPQ